MSGRLHIRIDGDIERAIKLYARANKLTKSVAARELLRQAIGEPAQPIDRGWREGYLHGYRAYMMEQARRAKEQGES